MKIVCMFLIMKVNVSIYPSVALNDLCTYLQNQAKWLLMKQMMIKKIQVNMSLIMYVFIDLSCIYTIVTENLESDEVRHKPKTDSDSASQNGMKTTFLILKS